MGFTEGHGELSDLQLQDAMKALADGYEAGRINLTDITASGLQKFDGVLINLGINEHYQSISRGVLDTRDLVYFISVIVLFLSITKTVLGGRKW